MFTDVHDFIFTILYKRTSIPQDTDAQQSANDSDPNLKPLAKTQRKTSVNNKLRRNSISLPALNNVDLETLQQSHMDQITRLVSVSVMNNKIQ